MKFSKSFQFFTLLSLIFMIEVKCTSNQHPQKNHITSSPTLIIFDTTHRESFLYQPFIEIVQSLNWHVQYLGFDKILNSEEKELPLSEASAVFFILGIEFLNGIYSSSATEKILTILSNFANKKNRLLGLIFPSLNINPQTNLILKFNPIFKSIGITQDTSHPSIISPLEYESIKNFIITTNNFLTRPVEKRYIKYHTSLNSPHHGQIFPKSDSILNILPNENKYSDPIKTTMPYGFYWFNPVKKNNIFISNSTILSFSGITENCHFCPSKFTLRREMLYGVQDMLSKILQTNNLDVLSTSSLKNHDPIKKFGKKISQENNCPVHKTAWMELNIFETPQFDSKISVTEQEEKLKIQEQQQNQLIEYIVKSNIDSLWISLNPHMYYSPIAKKVNQEKILIDSISLFTKKLKTALDKMKSKPPKILVGFEIANNLYEPNLPKDCAHDIYGNSYFDIPDPLNQNFWNNELEKPLEKIINQWNKAEINNGLSLSGVTLDLEMYCRRTSGVFLSTMGLNKKNINSFIHKNNIKLHNTKFNDIIKFLIENRLLEKYFEFLENQAFELGKKLRSHFNKQIPSCIISCYIPSILINWFYTGLFKGLSDSENPLHLFTFNTEFLTHKKWFLQNKTYVTHSSVLLLSKLTNKESFKHINKILKHHHGIWFNRFSRLIEPKTDDWTTIEKPQIPQEQYKKFIDYLSKIK